MASNINTTTINTAYPVAGQDNDSQGFRDNFTNINSNFTSAKSEITALQATTVFTPEFRTPATAIGASGDVKGMSAFDASYMYVCVADHDGAASIWRRTATATW